MTNPAPAHPYILTASEAASVLRVDSTNTDMLILLPMVDNYIKQATGRDWALDTPVDLGAKAAARILLTQWFEDPGMQGVHVTSLDVGLNAVLQQLEVRALELKTISTPADVLAISVSMPQDKEEGVACSVVLVLVWNHAMADPTGTIVLADDDGNNVALSMALDLTGKIMTITPATDLSVNTHYNLNLTATPDIYGNTMTVIRTFTTA